MSATRFEERLWPGPGVLVALALSFPMVSLALAPFGWGFAIISGLSAWGLVSAVALLSSPVIRVTPDELSAGDIRVPLAILRKVELLSGEEARIAKGPGLDPRAAHLIRGDVRGLIKIYIQDPNDPTPYLLLSTRRGDALAQRLAS